MMRSSSPEAATGSRTGDNKKMSVKRPFWSVMIPTYRPDLLYLRKNIQNLLAQHPGPEEMQIMVIDDASPDFEPRRFLDSIGMRHIPCLKHRQQLRLAGNWNECISHAKGEWIHILHQDDLVLPGFYRRLRKGIESAPSVGAAYCRDMVIDEAGQPGRRQHLEMERAGILSDWIEPIVVGLRVRASAIVVKSEVYRILGGFDSTFEYALDWDMWKRIAATYPIWYEPEIFACCRIHEASATGTYLENAKNIDEIRKSIEYTDSRLPPDIRAVTARRSRLYYTDYAVWCAEKRYRAGNKKSALAHIKAARKLTSGWVLAGAIIRRMSTSSMNRSRVVNRCRRALQRNEPVLAMSLLVRDEVSLIAHNLDFHRRMGVDKFVITDNGSVDGTRDLLTDLAKEYDITIIDQPDHTMEQDKWVNHMADFAAERLGADWIVNGDADEFWLPATGSLKSALDDRYGAFLCRRFNMLPEQSVVNGPDYVFTDNIYKVINPIDDTEYFYPRSAAETPDYPFTLRRVEVKVLCRLRGLTWIGYGNHAVKHKNRVEHAQDIQIYHFPVRTFSEFERKVVNHGTSLLNNPRIPQHTGWHVRRWYDVYRRGRLRQEYETLVPDKIMLQTWMDAGMVEVDRSIQDMLRAGSSADG